MSQSEMKGLQIDRNIRRGAAVAISADQMADGVLEQLQGPALEVFVLRPHRLPPLASALRVVKEASVGASSCLVLPAQTRYR